VFSRLLEAEKEHLRNLVEPRIGVSAFTVDHFEEPAGAFFLASILGLHDPLERVVESWPDYWYLPEGSAARHVPQIMIFGLGSAEKVDRHMRRLKLDVNHPHFARAWIAHTEYAGLDWVARTICQTKDKSIAAELVDVLALVLAPENVEAMLTVSMGSKVPERANAWLARHVGHAAVGYASLASSAGPLASTALKRLTQMTADGLHVLVDRSTQQLGGTRAADLVTAMAGRTLPELEDTPEWLRPRSRGMGAVKPPKEVDRSLLPDLDVGGQKLAPHHVEVILAGLVQSTLDAPERVVVGARRHILRESADAFAWRLFEQWMLAGAPSKGKWALIAVGLLGDDASAWKLAQLVREWPGEGFHQRAALGLEVLGAIGTEGALLQLSGIAQKLWYPALRKHADDLLAGIAKEWKTTRDELEDAIVPSGGFDASGRRFFTLGDRTFEVVLGRDATPVLRDTVSRRHVEHLPSPAQGDDLLVAQKVLADWKDLNVALKETFEVQSERLEQSMVKGRTWTPDAFFSRIVRHPLMSHLARFLIWGLWLHDGLFTTFRVTEDGTLADENDKDFELSAEGQVGLVHPFDVDEPTRTKWQLVLADYEILPPFEQLGRATYRLSKEELATKDLAARFAGRTWSQERFFEHLRERGWTHGSASGGVVESHWKAFPFANVKAVLGHTGLLLGRRVEQSFHEVQMLSFASLRTHLDSSWPAAWQLRLRDIEPRCISETLYDIEQLVLD
jgi:hypothetical protein